MKIGHIELLVSDPLRAQKFYVDVLDFEKVVVRDQFVWFQLVDPEHE